MGFGLLMFGYFLVNFIAAYRPLSAVMLLGFPLIIRGLFLLSPYHKQFFRCFLFSFLSLPFAVYYAVAGLTDLSVLPTSPIFEGAIATAVGWGYYAFSLVFIILLLSGIAMLTGNLGLLSLQQAAWRNLLLSLLYRFCYLVASLPIPWIYDHRGLFAIPITILRLICDFLILYLFYKAYRIIGPEESPDDLLPLEKKKGKKEKSNKEDSI